MDRNSDRIANTNKVKKTDNVKNTTNVKKTGSSSARKCFRCISSVKNQDIETSIPKKDDKNVFGNRIIDMGVFTTLISMFCCPECHISGIKLSE